MRKWFCEELQNIQNDLSKIGKLNSQGQRFNLHLILKLFYIQTIKQEAKETKMSQFVCKNEENNGILHSFYFFFWKS